MSNINKWISYAKKIPHEFTIQYPQDPQYFRKYFKKIEYSKPNFDNVDQLLLYFHIPFCESKCSYCNFAVDLSKDKYSEYIDALISEYDLYLNVIDLNKIKGIDIGGGTPTILPIQLLDKLLNKISHNLSNKTKNYKSIETTPQIAAFENEKIKLIKNAGFSRLSIGLQSSNNSIKSFVNRKSSINIDIAAVKNIYDSGIERINIDLIFGLPFQTEKVWLSDIKFAVSLCPTSITIYDCLYSRDNRKLNLKNLPSMAFFGKLYDYAYNYLIANGYYAQYGSENFSKIQYESGTSDYFEGRILKGFPYIGIGNYATTQIDNYWWFNFYNTKKYISAINKNTNHIQDFYELPYNELMTKFILGNLNYGIINKQYFYDKFGIDIENKFNKIFSFLLKNNWMRNDADEWKLMEGRFNKINIIKSLFYTEGMKDWMVNNNY